MKTAFLFAAMVLLAGCASQNPKFAGLPVTRGAKAEGVWNERLAVSPSLKMHNSAIVRAVRGDASISENNGGSWKRAQVGARVHEGDLIQTEPDGSTDLFLGDNGPVVRVTSDSRLRIVRLTLENTGIEKVTDTMMDLEKGKILGSVKKMAAASNYMIRTPAGVLRVRGTEFSASADGSISVISGTVVVLMGEKEIILTGFQECGPNGDVKTMKPSGIAPQNAEDGSLTIGSKKN